MNIIDMQNRLKNLSEEQLVQQMQAPTGEIPPFLILSEITRRQKMRADFEGQQAQGEEQTTVAQDAIAAAGVPAGFAGQMAGAMAPQTDPRENTAAAPAGGMPGGAGVMAPPPQQGVAALPQGAAPVPGMAAGGIVALNSGGFVNDGQRGRTFVSGGMRYIINDRGELIPWAPEGVAPPAGAYRPEGGNISGHAVGEFGMQPETPVTPRVPMGSTTTLADVPTLPEPPEPSATSIAPVSQPTVARPSLLPPPPTTGVEVSPADGEQDGLLSRIWGYVEDPIRDTATILSPFASAEEREAAAMRRDPSSRQTSGEPLEEVVLPGDLEQAASQSETTPDAAARAAGARAGSATGIAGLAGAAATEPSSFEQELLDMLAARERRAEQDRWLSLAQFGLNLMSSREPTLGGAIGEAGQPALESLRSGRESAEADRLGMLQMLEQHRMGQQQLAMQQQAMRARAAASSGVAAGPSGEISAGEQRRLAALDADIERARTILNNEVVATEAERLEAQQILPVLTSQRAALLGHFSGIPHPALGGSIGSQIAPGVAPSARGG